MKAIEKSIVVGLIFSALYNAVDFSVSCENINSKIFRLHILANSDSAQDQNLKIRIKNKIQQFSQNVLNDYNSKEEAESIFIKNLSNIEEIAKKEIKNCGYNYPICSRVANSYFSTRNYEDFVLPAGNYDALEIKIGSGEGKNWWCILFPMLCVGTAKKSKRLNKTFCKNERDIICNKRKKYVIRFKFVEMYHTLRNWINKKLI